MTQKEVNKYILLLIEDEKKELARSKVYEYCFTFQIIKPKTMGITKATEDLGVWQKHIASVENRINMYKEYINNHQR